jgi:ATP-dependent Clp protease ATP-binding subunit ClpC
MKEKVEGEMKKHFKPELLNRLDGVVVFRSLDKKSLEQIVGLEVDKVQKRLAPRQIYFTLEESAKLLLVESGYEPEMGARPLRRAIEELLEDPLAEKLLHHPQVPYHCVIGAEAGKMVVSDAEQKVAKAAPA